VQLVQLFTPPAFIRLCWRCDARVVVVVVVVVAAAASAADDDNHDEWPTVMERTVCGCHYGDCCDVAMC